MDYYLVFLAPFPPSISFLKYRLRGPKLRTELSEQNELEHEATLDNLGGLSTSGKSCKIPATESPETSKTLYDP